MAMLRDVVGAVEEMFVTALDGLRDEVNSMNTRGRLWGREVSMSLPGVSVQCD